MVCGNGWDGNQKIVSQLVGHGKLLQIASSHFSTFHGICLMCYLIPIFSMELSSTLNPQNSVICFSDCENCRTSSIAMSSCQTFMVTAITSCWGKLGLPDRQTIFFDMEGFPSSSMGQESVAQKFLSFWLVNKARNKSKGVQDKSRKVETLRMNSLKFFQLFRRKIGTDVRHHMIFLLFIDNPSVLSVIRIIVSQTQIQDALLIL